MTATDRSSAPWAPDLNALIEAAMRACARWDDDYPARDQMRREVLATPNHLRADLLAHFIATYPKGDQP